MIEITKAASEKLIDYLSKNDIESTVRVAVRGGCGGTSLGLVLDERKENDHVQEKDSFTILIDRNLSEACGKVTVDFIEKSSGCGCGGGFSVTTEKPLSSAGGGCGSSCSSGSCDC